MTTSMFTERMEEKNRERKDSQPGSFPSVRSRPIVGNPTLYPDLLSSSHFFMDTPRVR